MADIYLVFSSTQYRIGKMIRRITGESYNHASIALDANLTRMYSFARRHHSTPFYGGFVRESLSRYCFNGVPADVCICKLPVTQTQYEWLENTLQKMEENKEHYLYNHFSAAYALFHKNLPLEDAYTCVEFSVAILYQLGFPVDCTKYYSVGDLKSLFDSETIYTGPIPAAAEKDLQYYKPIKHPIAVTVSSFRNLMCRPKIKHT